MPQVILRGVQSPRSLVDATVRTRSGNSDSTFFIIPYRPHDAACADYLRHMYNTVRYIDLHAGLPVHQRRWQMQLVTLPFRFTLPNLVFSATPSMLLTKTKAYI